MAGSFNRVGFVLSLMCLSWSGAGLVFAGGKEALKKESVGENQTDSIVQFRLDSGGQYQLCRDYVDMLNHTRYTTLPVCSRKVLKEYDLFKVVDWIPVKEKQELEYVLESSVESSLVGAYDPEGKRRKRYRQIIDRYIQGKGYPMVHRSSIDMDYDGGSETVYEIDWGRSGDFPCNEDKSYVVIDDAEGFSNHAKNGYIGLSFRRSPYRLFYYEGRIYNDYWLYSTSKYILKVNEIHGRANELCGINIIVEGE